MTVYLMALNCFCTWSNKEGTHERVLLKTGGQSNSPQSWKSVGCVTLSLLPPCYWALALGRGCQRKAISTILDPSEFPDKRIYFSGVRGTHLLGQCHIHCLEVFDSNE